jgi:hypothetical protein
MGVRLLGIDEYLHAFQGDSNVQSVRTTLAERLLDLFRRTRTPDWPWFEDRLTYSNARLSQAMVVSGARMENEEMTAVGTSSLAWLASIQCSEEGTSPPSAPTAFTAAASERRCSTSNPSRHARWCPLVSRRGG